MASALGVSQKGSVNVELNIVPFIDLMSCLTAFLLVTAVWVNTAHLKNAAAGRGRDSVDQPAPPTLSVLIQKSGMIVAAHPSNEIRQVASADWAQLELALKELRPVGEDTPRVEIAAESTPGEPITYQTLIAAMDTTVRAGFPDVGVTEPSSLSN